MPDPLSAVNLRTTPQDQSADPRQVPNSAGGRTFTVAPLERLRRFLVLGTDGGTYYASERRLTKTNADVVLDWARTQAVGLVDEVVSVSAAGRAPRNNTALFALAAAASLGDAEGRKAALAALPTVARTGTHLFLFAGYIEQFRGWGRGLRRAVADWYLAKPVDAVAYQAVKYRQREGWSHRDLLRLAHPATDDVERKQLFDWICGRSETGPAIVAGFQRAQSATSTTAWLSVLDEYPALSWEMLPNGALGEPAVWAKLIDNGLPQTALLRQLPRLTRLGLLDPLSSTLAAVVAQLTDAQRLRKARIHPVNVLVAARTYAAGVSARGQSTWEPSGAVIDALDALDAAFYSAFASVQPAGKRTMLALDDLAGRRDAAHLPRGLGRAVAGDRRDRARDRDRGIHRSRARRPERDLPSRRGCGRDLDAAHLAPATARRRDQGRVRPAVRWHRLLVADALGPGEQGRGGHVRRLHRQRDVGGSGAPAPGAAALPRLVRHRRPAGRRRVGGERLHHRRPVGHRHAGHRGVRCRGADPAEQLLGPCRLIRGSSRPASITVVRPRRWRWPTGTGSSGTSSSAEPGKTIGVDGPTALLLLLSVAARS